MPDQPDSPPAEHSKRRHRGIVWTMIVLASVLLVFSITANWVQRELLNTDEVKSTTDQILEDQDVQEALSTYSVDELYANVDVQGEIQNKLPASAQALAVPVTAATKQLALNVAQKALASPRVQGLVTTAVGAAQEQFVDLIEDKDQYVSTTGGQVTLEYGSVIANLAEDLGVDPSTVSQVQSVVQEYTTDLQQGLTTAQSSIKSARSKLKKVQEGKLSSEQTQDLQTLNKDAAELHGKIASLDQKLKGVQGSVPSQLKGALSDLEGRLAELDGRLATLQAQTAAVLKDPSSANVDSLDSALGAVDSRINTALNRQAVQHPGQLVLVSSSQLDSVQNLVGALRNLGYVLPLLSLVLILGALFLAQGWRREALIAAGGGIVIATLVVLLARRLIGSEVVDSLASSETVEPAVQSIWDILADGLRERALFALVIGLAFIAAGLVAGPARWAVALRRSLAPAMRDHPVAVYAVVAVLFLLWLSFIPGINNLGQVLVIVVLAVLAIIGVEVLRRQTAREFPPGASGL